MSSSVTDTDAYRDICLRAASDPAVFRTFREHPDYAHVVAISREVGEQCRRMADPALLALIDTTDNTLCRYAWQLTRMLRLFGSFDGLRVLEIGGGFGGMCRLIHSFCLPASYTIVDLPEVQALQARYLEYQSVPLDRVEFVPADDLVARDSDVLVSNWAFSELRPDWQHRYAGLFLERAARGYMECNFIQDCLPPDGVQALVPGSVWIPDVPPTHELNRVLVWGIRT